MGYNSSTYDKEAAYASKSVKQLEDELKHFRQAIEKWDSNGLMKSPPTMFNEHIEYLRLKIAERILKK